MHFGSLSSTPSSEPLYRRHQELLSVVFDTIALIAVSIISFSLAKRVEWDSPRFGTLLRFIPVGGALLWLFRRLNGCEGGSMVRWGRYGNPRRLVHHSHPHSLPYSSVYQSLPHSSASAFSREGPGSEHFYHAGEQLYLQENGSSSEDDSQLFPVGNNSGWSSVDQVPESGFVRGPGPRNSYLPSSSTQQTRGKGWTSWFGFGSHSQASSSPPSFETSSTYSHQSHDSSTMPDWSSSHSFVGGGGNNEPAMYSVGSHSVSHSGPGRNNTYTD